MSGNITGIYPNIPENLIAQLDYSNPGKVLISFLPVSGVRYYIIYVYENNAIVSQMISYSTTYRVDGLVVDHAYQFTVTAVNQLGESIQSPKTPPLTVVGLPSFVPTASVTYNASFPVVQYTQSSEISTLGYHVYSYINSTMNSSMTSVQSPLTYTSGLVKGNTYRFRVASFNVIGEGPLSGSNSICGWSSCI